MNVTQQLSSIHKAKLVSLTGNGWKMDDRHVTSLIGAIIMAGLLTSNSTPAFGLSEDTAPKPSIKQISKAKLDSSNLYFYEYCQSQNNLGIIGFLVISNVERVPVLINTEIKAGTCQTYGAKIYTDGSDFVKTKLLTISELPAQIQYFENKKMTLEDKLVNEQQKLNTYYKTNASNEKISQQIEKIDFLKNLINSARSSIVLLRSV